MSQTFYCDGSFKNGRCGWALYVAPTKKNSRGMVIYGVVEKGTNNIGELTAMLETLKTIPMCCDQGSKIVVYGDSRYVIDGLTSSGVVSKIDTSIESSVRRRSLFERVTLDGWVRGWIKNGWKTASGGDVKNKTLWVSILEALDKLSGKYDVKLKWVKGHSSSKGNDIVDVFAKGEG